MNLLLTSIGKRVQLVKHLKKNFRVIGADAGEENAARNFVDAFYQIPRCTQEGYLNALLHICQEEEVKVLIPLYEAEFPILAGARELFDEIGVILLLSDFKVIDVCKDKLKMAKLFESAKIPSPKSYQSEEIQDKKIRDELTYPLIVKPRDGMGSEGVYLAKNEKEVLFFSEYVNEPIIQECAEGAEYTIDVLCDLHGEPVYVIPRIRLEVRAGEVVKSKTVNDAKMIALCMDVLQALKGVGMIRGPLNVQCFKSVDGKYSFIEVNPRFGGGMPLSFEAGADFAQAIEMMCRGEEPGYQASKIKELTMLRYDSAVYYS